MAALRKAAPFVILAAGVAALAFGIARGELNPLFMAATNVCLSCIGIG
ncbi:CD1871A family CXXC motif-containing protein [Adlercreutzia aquisgranensis]|nr:CD1871A family CXXC motif-containing protein [Adlercreutzia aquisgranensis]